MSQRLCYGCMQMVTEDVCPHCGTAAADQNASDQLPVGTLLRGQYLVGRVLGQGGFGITYIGLDTYLDEVVAIKEFFPTSAVNRDVSQTCSVQLNSSKVADTFAAGRDRFLREAKILAKLRGIPEIVDIRTMFPENNTAYIVMEYVRGIDLREYVRRRGGKLSVEETLKLLEPIAYALDMVHQEELVHRDVSPDNIMFQPQGRTKLLDFGISRDAGSTDTERDLSHSTEAILKHGFAPMEQYRSRGNLGPWTDEYSFCATMYYCLTGKVPPEAPVWAMGDEQPDWQSIEGLSQVQRAALEKGMSLRAKDRFGSMEKLHRALYVPGVNMVSEPEEKQEVREVPAQVREAAQVPSEQTAQGSAAGNGKKLQWILSGAAVILLAALFLFAGPGRNDRKDDPVADSVDTPTTVVTEAPVLQNILRGDSVDLIWSEAKQAYEGQRVFGTDILRDDIVSICFLDTLSGAPKDAFDVSEGENGTVMAWTVPNGEKLDLFIAGEGGVIAPENAERMFALYRNVETVDFAGVFDTSNVRDMSRMFAHCDALTKLNLSGWKTGVVHSMHAMFAGCGAMQTVILDRMDTSSVSDMVEMFYDCSSLMALDLSSFDTSLVTDMSYMFYGCSSLESIDVSSFKTAQVTDMSHMFQLCSALPQLDISNFDTGNVIDMSFMLYDCTNLVELNVGTFNTDKVEKHDDFMISWKMVNGKTWKALFRDYVPPVKVTKPKKKKTPTETTPPEAAPAETAAPDSGSSDSGSSGDSVIPDEGIALG